MNNKNYVTDAINLKSYNLNDADKIVLMYSKDNGLIKGVAKGVKKTKNKLGARMDLLNANSVKFVDTTAPDESDPDVEFAKDGTVLVRVYE